VASNVTKDEYVLWFVYRKRYYKQDRVWSRGAPKGWGICMLQPPLPPTNQNLKNTEYVHTMIFNILCDLPFSKNQPQKLADN
jgi:hypothetical protein